MNTHSPLVKDMHNISALKNILVHKPILKWVGGKSQIIDSLLGEFPTEINNYYEVFLGGGSVLFALLTMVQQGHIHLHGNVYAYDVNEALIYVYKNIQTQHNQLYEQLQQVITDYNNCIQGELNRTPQNIQEAKESKENFYYWIRLLYNKLSPEEKTTAYGSALFIFLNKTCFRGMFRTGPNGFNVPYGNYKNPEIMNKTHLDEIHNLIQGVQFECCDYRVALQRISTDANDYVYLDPPYFPETKTSFTGYTEKGFSLSDHMELFAGIHALTEKNKKLMMSNADVGEVRGSFGESKYTIRTILCKRAIHSKNPETKTNEVIITNY